MVPQTGHQVYTLIPNSYKEPHLLHTLAKNRNKTLNPPLHVTQLQALAEAEAVVDSPWVHAAGGGGAGSEYRRIGFRVQGLGFRV